MNYERLGPVQAAEMPIPHLDGLVQAPEYTGQVYIVLEGDHSPTYEELEQLIRVLGIQISTWKTLAEACFNPEEWIGRLHEKAKLALLASPQRLRSGEPSQRRPQSAAAFTTILPEPLGSQTRGEPPGRQQHNPPVTPNNTPLPSYPPTPSTPRGRYMLEELEAARRTAAQDLEELERLARNHPESVWELEQVEQQAREQVREARRQAQIREELIAELEAERERLTHEQEEIADKEEEEEVVAIASDLEQRDQQPQAGIHSQAEAQALLYHAQSRPQPYDPEPALFRDHEPFLHPPSSPDGLRAVPPTPLQSFQEGFFQEKVSLVRSTIMRFVLESHAVLEQAGSDMVAQFWAQFELARRGEEGSEAALGNCRIAAKVFKDHAWARVEEMERETGERLEENLEGIAEGLLRVRVGDDKDEEVGIP
ncbi:hypothetical protein MKZ38_007618 [Zalerion maritima]|uniref:Uncharacterized protein n=1 Tax=Zalerion maritima TaxID=339359 RepID=A0AAD5RYS5_9PEZI|nr:hypothetical protein MKZ38_007618 [Zalerion maritima]